MADIGNTDFWPDSPIQSLRRQQGIRPTESEYGYEPAPLVRGNDIDVPGDGGFTARDYLDASFELYCFDVKRQNDARKREGRVMTDRKALPDIPRSPDTHKAFDALWRNPLRPETIIGYITAREADIRAWVDANYVRKDSP